MKNLLKISSLVGVLLFVLTGCGKNNPSISTSTIHIPSLNKISNSEIGQNMYKKVYGNITASKFVKLKDDNREYKFAKVDDAECAIHNGSESLLDYNCDGSFTHKRGSLFNRGKEKNKLKSPIKYKYYTKNNYRPFNGSFKYEALYQGKQGNKIKVTFREFYLNKKFNKFMIRNAFTQNIDYELNKKGSTIIGFKGLRIEVIKATNLDITYKVIKDYN